MTLKEFLKEKRALTKFRINYRTLEGRKTKAEAEEFITENATTPNGIVSAFTWADTPEGGNYWYTLDDEWVYICNKK